MSVIKIIIHLVMLPVEAIRKDTFSYISAPKGTLNWVSSHSIATLWHTLPSVALAAYIAIEIAPMISESYALKLANNEPIVPITIIVSLIPILIIVGIVIETILENSSEVYKQAKKDYVPGSEDINPLENKDFTDLE